MIVEMVQFAVYTGIALLVSWQMTLGALLAGGLSALTLSAFMGNGPARRGEADDVAEFSRSASRGCC